MEAADIRAWRAAVESDLVENILPFWSRLETEDGYLGGLSYGFSEYFMATGDTGSLERAMGLFELLEAKAWNTHGGGYGEAHDRQWGPQNDVRLSSKDLNAQFTMNTHLHLMEAYANLLKASRHPSVEAGCRRVVRVVIDRIILPSRDHFGLFYSKDWELLNDDISPGHDIEGSWLLWETAEIIAEQQLLNEVRPIALAMAPISRHHAMSGIILCGGSSTMNTANGSGDARRMDV